LLNWIFIFLIGSATLAGAYNGSMEAVTKAGIDSAKSAVELAIGLIGQMAFWLGMMKILQDAGLIRTISVVMSRVLGPIFPEIPKGHPAMAAIVMNMAANILGLANAATPFGLKAMRELQSLNPHKRVATNSMALFLAINTSGVAVLPLGVIAVRGMFECNDPAGIIAPSMLSTACSTVIAIIVATILSKRGRFSVERAVAGVDEEPEGEDGAAIKGLEVAEKIVSKAVDVRGWGRVVMPLFGVALLVLVIRHGMGAPAEASTFEVVKGVLADWLLPVLSACIVMFGMSRRVRVYESFVAGAKEGFEIAVMIIPFLVGILCAIGVFRASGLLELIIGAAAPLTELVGMPPEALPMALIRPLSGSGALTVLMDTLKTHGKDSFVGFLVSVMNGSTETTFYVLAVYFGSVGVRAARHTVWACLAADFTGICMALVFARIFF